MVTPNPFDTLFAPRPKWFDDAECRGADTNMFFPTQGEGNAEAVKICARCPVADECAAFGANERHGIYGGLSARARLRTHTRQLHGTVARYNTGCRCNGCVGAASRYRAEYRAKRGVA